MNDYSDVLFLIGAMAIYALLVTNASRAMFYNNQLLVTTEMEYGAVSVAQDVVEKVRWMKYDEVTESNKNAILEDVTNNPDFDDYVVEIDIHPPNNPKVDQISDKPVKQIDVIVTNKYMGSNKKSSNVTTSFIKTNRKNTN